MLPYSELIDIVRAAETVFGGFSEITVEANPGDDLSDCFFALRAAGVNRVSLGVQSANDNELRVLGRRHTAAQTELCVCDLKVAGFDNISLDLMLGIPGQTVASLSRSIDFCLKLEPSHISAYMLKIEPNTPFGRNPPPGLPDDDTVSDMYLYICRRLKSEGFSHYEISNFCLPGYESRHNMKYWIGAPYLGLGPGAHGFINGKRYFFPRDIAAFTENPVCTIEGTGGGESEYVMLRLRLSSGIDYDEYSRLFNKNFSKEHEGVIRKLRENGLAVSGDKNFALTARGFLVQNSILCELI